MRSTTVLLSAGVHVAIGAAIFIMAQEKDLRQATSFTVVEDTPKKPKPPPPPPPTPPPPVHHAPPKAAPSISMPPPPAPTPTPVPAPVHAAPVNTGLQLSNSGPGLAVGGSSKGPARSAPQTVKAQPAAARPPPPTPAAPAECTEQPTKPVPVFKTNPEYTDAARAAGIEGRLVVRIYVGADGSVVKVEVVSSVDAALDAAAIATIQKWRFTPSLKCGKAVDGGVYVFAQKFELVGD